MGWNVLGLLFLLGGIGLLLLPMRRPFGPAAARSNLLFSFYPIGSLVLILFGLAMTVMGNVFG